MTEKSLLLILGNQLFPIDNIKSLNPDIVFMAEDLGLSTYETVSYTHLTLPTKRIV